MPAGTLQEDIYHRHISCWAPLGKGYGAGDPGSEAQTMIAPQKVFQAVISTCMPCSREPSSSQEGSQRFRGKSHRGRSHASP